MFRMSLSLSRWNWKLIPRNEAAGSESMKIIREENDPVLVFSFILFSSLYLVFDTILLPPRYLIKFVATITIKRKQE